MRRSITATDKEIIRLLQQNARASFAEMSRQTGIPESTVRRRTERLQEQGIVEFTMMADPTRLGFDLRAIIGLRVDVEVLDTIAETIRNMPEVTFAAFVTGSVDIIAPRCGRASGRSGRVIAATGRNRWRPVNRNVRHAVGDQTLERMDSPGRVSGQRLASGFTDSEHDDNQNQSHQ